MMGNPLIFPKAHRKVSPGYGQRASTQEKIIMQQQAQERLTVKRKNKVLQRGIWILSIAFVGYFSRGIFIHTPLTPQQKIEQQNQVLNKMANNICWQHNSSADKIFVHLTPEKDNAGSYHIQCHWEQGKTLSDGSFAITAEGYDDGEDAIMFKVKKSGEE